MECCKLASCIFKTTCIVESESAVKIKARQSVLRTITHIPCLNVRIMDGQTDVTFGGERM